MTLRIRRRPPPRAGRVPAPSLGDGPAAHPAETPVPPTPPGAPDTVSLWLDTLTRLLGLPAAESAAIRDELDNHLRERTLDLLRTGSNEHEAAARAIAELGDAALLARGFRDARRSTRRRLLMNVTLFGMAGAALAMSLVAVTGTPTAPSQGMTSDRQDGTPTAPLRRDVSVLVEVLDEVVDIVSADRRYVTLTAPSLGNTPAVRTQDVEPSNRYSWAADEAPAATDETAERRFDVDFNESALRDALTVLGEMTGRPTYVNWPALENAGIARDTTITLRAHQVTIATVLRLISNQLGPDQDTELAYTTADGLFEVDRRANLDRREVVFASYELADIFTWPDAEEEIDRLVELIKTTTEPGAWSDDGDSLAQIHVVNRKMFVRAPQRFHAPIAWVLEQLKDRPRGVPAGHAAAPDAPAAAPAAAGDVQLIDDVPIIEGVFTLTR